eukprot:1928806-Prymnesium_polylepis.2
MIPSPKSVHQKGFQSVRAMLERGAGGVAVAQCATDGARTPVTQVHMYPTSCPASSSAAYGPAEQLRRAHDVDEQEQQPEARASDFKLRSRTCVYLLTKISAEDTRRYTRR